LTLKDIEKILYEKMEIIDVEYEFYAWNADKLQAMLKVLSELPTYTKRQIVFVFIDFVLISAFTIELILRLCTCPNIKRYFFSFMNTLDFIVLVVTYADLIVEYKLAKYRYEEKGIKIFFYLQMLRVLRVMRYVQHIPSIRVLGYTMRTNMKDLCVLFLYMLIGILLFSNFIYFAEDEKDFANIPEAWWWGIITMTTVGYGDRIPRTVLGRIIGSLCALSGVLVLSLTIPVFVNTFVSLYNFSHLYERFLKNQTDDGKSNKVKSFADDVFTEMTPVEVLNVNKLEINDTDVDITLKKRSFLV